MENRYLFRGKTIRGDWVRGLLASKDNKWYIGNKVGRPLAFEIRPESICQCTGLKDKNGKLIFGNDILSGHIDVEFPEYETRKRVVWYENGWCTNEPNCDDYEALDDFDSENFEVIGNKIDNPELWEG